ncbi:hypothetical protein ACMZOO_10650 [Catenovulum sp. SX2]|uniref:hypothetical protein n=1 Tax=Catenovulum sp. SX2 TaxID=3398614 RepID=UPI003F829C71
MLLVRSHKNVIAIILLAGLTSFTAIAESAKAKANKLIENCKTNSASQTAYAICLDETEKQVLRELQTWIVDAEDKLTAQVNNSGNQSMLSEFKRANAHYDKFIESQCRSVFFQNLTSSEAASKFRACKITKTIQRIEQLKEESE